jgi:5-methylcytosine-specific restriction protein B
VRFLQFHPGYQYEDFVEGYVPDAKAGGFHIADKHFLDICRIAGDVSPLTCVLVVDELSRCEPARVFGEALTYIEGTKRDESFSLASGRTMSVPRNLVVLGTMNVMDKGVQSVESAFERRFARIAMEPDGTALRSILESNDVEPGLLDRILRFFEWLNKQQNPLCHIGHAYFDKVRNVESLERLWDSQLRFQLEKANRLDATEFRDIERRFRGEILQEGAAEAEASA